jgi:hypothetical protein
MLYRSLTEISKLENARKHRPSFTHVINPFNAVSGSEHDIAQSTTLRSISMAKKCTPDIPVEVLCVVYPEDKGVVPAEFICLDILSRSISDFVESDLSIKLPLLFDFLSAGIDYSSKGDNEYLIYSNIDIGLMPFFYQTITDILNKGFDAVVVNRRSVDHDLHGEDNYGLLLSSMGKKHPGSDCFVVKKDLVDKFVRSQCCLGVINVMKSLMFNMAATAEKMVIVADAHATFHIGDDRRWTNEKFKPYTSHNRSEAERVARELIAYSPEYKRKLQDYAIQKNEGMLIKLLGLEEKAILRGRKSMAKSMLLFLHRGMRRGFRLLRIGSYVKRLVHGGLGVLGYELRRMGRSELVTPYKKNGLKSGKNNGDNIIEPKASDLLDPRYISYLISDKPVLLHVEPKMGRAIPLFSYSATSVHPFVLAARAAIERNEQEWFGTIFDILEKYYELVSPSTAGELAGASEGSELHQYPSCALTMPWDRFSPVEQLARLEKFTKHENALYDEAIDISDGWAWGGSVRKQQVYYRSNKTQIDSKIHYDRWL